MNFWYDIVITILFLHIHDKLKVISLQVKLSNSTVRLEHMPGLEQRGIALELQVDSPLHNLLSG